MKESINLFMKLSSDVQGQIRKIYNTHSTSEEDKKILSKLFSEKNLKLEDITYSVIKNITVNNQYINSFKHHQRDITIGDIVMFDRQIGCVKNFDFIYNHHRVLIVDTKNSVDNKWVIKNVELLNTYSIGTTVYMPNYNISGTIEKVLYFDNIGIRYSVHPVTELNEYTNNIIVSEKECELNENQKFINISDYISIYDGNN